MNAYELRKMTPVFPPDDETNVALGSAILVRKDSLGQACFMPSSNRQHRFCGQLGSALSFTSGYPFGVQPGRVVVSAGQAFGVLARRVSVARETSVFAPHIGVVIGGGAEPEVTSSWLQNAVDFIRADVVIPNTGVNITGMQNQESIRDWSGGQSISGPVSGHDFASQSKATVAIWVGRASPEPAGFSFLDLGPETLSNRTRFRSTAATNGRMSMHREPPTRGVTPQAVCAALGHLLGTFLLRFYHLQRRCCRARV